MVVNTTVLRLSLVRTCYCTSLILSRLSGRRNDQVTQICRSADLPRLYTGTSLRADAVHSRSFVDDEARARLWKSEDPRIPSSWSGSRQSSPARGSPCTKPHKGPDGCMDDRRRTSCLTTSTTNSDLEHSLRASTSYLRSAGYPAIDLTTG